MQPLKDQEQLQEDSPLVEVRSDQPAEKQQQESQAVLDPVALALQGNHVPLAMIAQQYGLSNKIQGIPLLHYLIQLFIPMSTMIKNTPSQMPLNDSGQCPLFIAVMKNNTEAALWLLRCTTKMVQDKWNYAAITYALRQMNYPVFFMCLLAGHRNKLLPHMAAMKNNRWAVQLLNTLGYIMGEMDNQGKPPFVHAAQNYSLSVLDFMSKKCRQAIIINHSSLVESPCPLLRQRIRKNFAEAQLKSLKVRFLPFIYKNKLQLVGLLHSLIITVYMLCLFQSDYSVSSSQVLLSYTLILALYTQYFIQRFDTRRQNPVNPALNRRAFFDLLNKTPQANKVSTAFHKIQKLIQQQDHIGLDCLDYENICPTCLIFREDKYTHCQELGYCVQGFHFYWLDKCVTRKNHFVYLILLLLHTVALLFFAGSLQIAGETYFLPLQLIRKVYTISQRESITALLLAVCYIFLGWLWLQFLMIVYQIVNGQTAHQTMNDHQYKHLFELHKIGEQLRYTRKRWHAQGLRGIVRNIWNYVCLKQ